MPDLPSGTVTFVFSDLEGSTQLLKQLGDAGYAEMLGMHRRLLRDTFAAHGGSEIDTQGDAFFYSFSRARAAVAAAVELQRRHEQQEWPSGARVRVRLGLHTGEPVVGEEGYTGLDVVRAARIAADGRGGQILLSEATRAIVGDDLPQGVDVRELGSRTLKDIDKPEPLYELVYGAQESEPEPQSAQSDSPTGPMPSDLTDINGWLQIASQAAREGDSFDPGPMIEQRVLRSLGEKMGGLNLGALGPPRRDRSAKREKMREGKTPAERASQSSVAEQLERLKKLHESGALSDEQYQRAVDRTLAEG
ncbi:MAG TPA: adenylate/guanylate cyclase domain-containing protein [Candidatus Limnocylindrales bacterium]